MFIHSQRLNFGIMRENTDVFMSLAPHDISLVQYFMNDENFQISEIKDIIILFRQIAIFHLQDCIMIIMHMRKLMLVGIIRKDQILLK